MRTVVRPLTITAIWLIVASVGLLGMGFIFEITTPPNTGANIGSAGCFLLGLGATGLGLLLGVSAVLVWLLGGRGDRHRTAPLLGWEKRLRRLTIAAVGLITIGAIVLSAGTLMFGNGHAGSGLRDSYPAFLIGLGITAAGLLAAIPPGLLWFSRWRTGTDL